jgi:hypothetical protein
MSEGSPKFMSAVVIQFYRGRDELIQDILARDAAGKRLL